MNFSAGKNCIWRILSEHNLDIFCPRRNGWTRSLDEAKYPILLLVLVVDRLNLKPLVLRRWSWMGQLGMLLAITKLLSSTLPLLATVPRATISSRWSLSSNHSKDVALQFVSGCFCHNKQMLRYRLEIFIFRRRNLGHMYVVLVDGDGFCIHRSRRDSGCPGDNPPLIQ